MEPYPKSVMTKSNIKEWRLFSQYCVALEPFYKHNNNIPHKICDEITFANVPNTIRC